MFTENMQRLSYRWDKFNFNNYTREKTMKNATQNLTKEQIYEAIGYSFIDLQLLLTDNEYFKDLPNETPFLEIIKITINDNETPKVLELFNSRTTSLTVSASVPESVLYNMDKMQEAVIKMNKEIDSKIKNNTVNYAPLVEFFSTYTVGEIKNHKQTTRKGIEILYNLRVPKEFPVLKEEFCEEYKKLSNITQRNIATECDSVHNGINEALEVLIQCSELGELGDFGFNEISEYDMYEANKEGVAEEMYDNVVLAIRLKKEALVLEENYKRILEIKELEDFDSAILQHAHKEMKISVEKVNN